MLCYAYNNGEVTRSNRKRPGVLQYICYTFDELPVQTRQVCNVFKHELQCGEIRNFSAWQLTMHTGRLKITCLRSTVFHMINIEFVVVDTFNVGLIRLLLSLTFIRKYHLPQPIAVLFALKNSVICLIQTVAWCLNSLRIAWCLFPTATCRFTYANELLGLVAPTAVNVNRLWCNWPLVILRTA